MAMRITFEVVADNSDEIMAEVMKRLNIGMEAIGQTAASVAAAKAPVDTGTLRNSISSAVTSTDHSVSAHIGTNVKAPKTGAPYPLYQEVGTSRIAGKHYLQWGIQGHASDYMNTIRNVLNERL